MMEDTKPGWLSEQFEKAQQYYNKLPDWKKNLIQRQPRK